MAASRLFNVKYEQDRSGILRWLTFTPKTSKFKNNCTMRVQWFKGTFRPKDFSVLQAGVVWNSGSYAGLPKNGIAPLYPSNRVPRSMHAHT